MSDRKVLKTKDIEQMTLKDFMAYKTNHYESVCLQELCEANTDWVRVDTLENIDTMKELREKTAQFKEDLWYKIQDRKRKREKAAEVPEQQYKWATSVHQAPRSSSMFTEFSTASNF